MLRADAHANVRAHIKQRGVHKNLSDVQINLIDVAYGDTHGHQLSKVTTQRWIATHWTPSNNPWRSYISICLNASFSLVSLGFFERHTLIFVNVNINCVYPIDTALEQCRGSFQIISKQYQEVGKNKNKIKKWICFLINPYCVKNS